MNKNKKIKNLIPSQLEDSLFWKACAFGIGFFSTLFFLSPSVSAHIANLL